MISGILLRHYKNYGNLKFIPICDSTEYMYSVYVGNNGVGKSAILEALDVVLNDRYWNVTIGMKKNEAYICPLFLIEKKKVSHPNRHMFECVSDYFWNADEKANANIKGNLELKKLLKYKDDLREKYEKNYYCILIGIKHDNIREAFCATFDGAVKAKIENELVVDSENVQDVLNYIKQEIWNYYSYLYLPIEETPSESLKLQNKTMQQLLNKNVLAEIEKVLNRKTAGKSIVTQINDNLDEFITEVNGIIAKVDEQYGFSSELGIGGKKNLTAKDIREKILEAYFPLRELKVNGKNVNQLSSGEQRKAIIDVAYSILIANGQQETERDIVLAIDEPENSMHISNCFNQFMMLEELAKTYKKQIILTTHWYGFLPIAQNGNMHHIFDGKIDSFCLYNIMEERRNFPDIIELKSMIDYMTIDKFACKIGKTEEPNYQITEERVLDMYISGAFPYRHVIVDEGQDFGREEIEEANLLQTIHDAVIDNDEVEGTFYVFYDRLQLIQASRIPKYISEADCKLTLYKNCRNTENIAITSLKPISQRTPKLYDGAIKGVPARIHFREDSQEAIERIETLIDELKNEGITDVVILTCKSEFKSILKENSDNGTFKKKVFTTCRKFKGLEADAIILIDVDEDTFGSEAVQRFYVGASRARLRLEIVTTMTDENCEKVLREVVDYKKKIKNAKRELALAFNAMPIIE